MAQYRCLQAALRWILQALDRFVFHARWSLRRRVAVCVAVLASPGTLRLLTRMWRRAAATRITFRQTEFNQRVVDACPSLKAYKPTPWLWNGHWQTTLGVGLRRAPRPDAAYTRVPLHITDGGVVQLDVTHPVRPPPRGTASKVAAGDEQQDDEHPDDGGVVATPTRDAARAASLRGSEDVTVDAVRATGAGLQLDADTPTLIVLHGLTGGSDEKYVRWMVTAGGKHGWQAIVLNARGCGGSDLATPRCFNAVRSVDVRATVHVARQHLSPDTPLYMVGYSLGAGILTTFLATEGNKLRGVVTAAVACCASYDMIITTNILEQPTMKATYNARLASNLHRFFRRHVNVEGMDKVVDVKAVLASRTVREFDAATVVPMFGYRDVWHYYRDASSGRRLGSVAVPLLMLNAEDDPVCSSKGIPLDTVRSNPHLVSVVTAEGGHVAWAQGWWPSDSWSDRAVLEFCDAVSQQPACLAPQATPVPATRVPPSPLPPPYPPAPRQPHTTP